MSFLVALVLVVVACIGLVAGLLMSNASVLLFAAVTSAAAVFLLWRRSKEGREQVHLSEAPEWQPPEWDRPLHERAPSSDSLEGETPEIVLDAYDTRPAAEILRQLPTLSVDELRLLVLREKAGPARLSVLGEAQRLIDLTEHGFDSRSASSAVRVSRAQHSGDELTDDSPKSRKRNTDKDSGRGI